ncbi:non-ribosomal peptide synthetase [Ramlibacter sp.]|uniref:non-ribosomal peptide synthetase n=1 Tax=Ramlibacter sp. TaxID=1917967 RepID=UPI0017FC08A4|nr:non-ribosomal peptide synthetase [Ramlibacter sp.]MBA2675527.1 amino acid adenylation domain-containing protein [Ramlibacter sp.]
MNAAEVLDYLQDQGVVLSVQEDDLVVQGKRNALSDQALIQRIRDNKPALIELIRNGGARPARAAQFVVPPNAIPAGARAITPAMLPLVQLTQSQVDRVVATVPGGAGNVQDIYPLAPLQEGILLHHQTAPQGDMYIETSVIPFESRAQIDAFVRALQAVVDRHDVLRTAYVWDDLPEPVQVVWRAAPLAVELFEARAADGPVAEQLQRRFDPRHHRMDLAQAPLIRLCIAHDAASGRWLMLKATHHLWGDHTTNELLHEEVVAHLLGQTDHLPPALPFRNFVAQARLGIPREEHEAFFRKMLGDVDEPTAPFGLANLQGQLSEVEVVCERLDDDLAKRLRRCARTAGVSVATLCHLAYALVLARVSGRDDVVFGTLLFGRMHGGEGADRVLGMFLNSLPIRIRVDATGVREAVAAVHRLLSELLRHEHAPLALAQRCSAIAAPTPLFNASFNYRYSATTQAPEHQANPYAGLGVASGDRQSELPLIMAVDDLGEALELTVHVDTRADAHSVCGLMHAALAQLAGALEQAPATPLDTLDVLPAAERQRLVAQWNATGVDFAREQCIHEAFEAHAANTPDAVALVQGDASLAYGALNAQANRLAHYLSDLGVGPGTRVAICAERGFGLVVGLLAVLKAGGAYVPLDPDYPRERLNFLLHDSDPTVVLLDAVGAKALGDGVEHRCVALDVQDPPWADGPEGNLPPASLGLTSEHLAYVIYTSGSTGQPKGVMATHRGLANLAAAQAALFGLSPTSRVLQFASQSFDASIFELVMGFVPGATLVLAPTSPDRWSGEALADYMARHEVTHATLPPALVATMPLPSPGQPVLPRLATLVMAGEAPNPAVAAAWARGRAVFNAYGPTETTVWSTAHRCGSDETDVVPIGHPVANTRIHLLDAHGRLAPLGVPGEICIAGAGVTRGYLNRPELTEERFVPDPFDATPGARMYRTGDLARRQPDGNLVFLGRNDFQVKIRGFRIELGEIEAKLAEHPSVREAAVLAQDDGEGSKRLVAYYTESLPTDDLDWNEVFANILGGDQPAAPDNRQMAKELHAHLARLLPDHMVPSAYVRLDALPLTPNGKLDRKALPDAEGAAQAARRHEPPEGELEGIVARVWSEVLKVERLGRHDNVFELGAHSMLLPTVVGMLRRDDLRINVMDIFPHPTVASLAAHLKAQALEHALGELVDSIVPVRKTGTQRPLFLVHETHGLDMYFPVIGQHIDADIPVYGLPGMPLDGPQLQTLPALAERMAGIIRTVQPEGPVRLAGWSFGGMLAYEIASQLRARGEAVEFIGLLDTVAGPEVPEDGPAVARPDTPHGVLIFACEAQAESAPEKRRALDALAPLAGDIAYDDLFARCAGAGLLPHFISRMNATEGRQYLARLVAHENAIGHYAPPPVDVPVHLFVAEEEMHKAGPDYEFLGWDKVLPAHSIRKIAVKGNHRTMVEVHADALGRAMTLALTTSATNQ